MGTSLTDGLRELRPRFGARVAIPVRRWLQFYPGLELEPGLALSQAFLDVRITPLAARGPWSSWYVGGGVALTTYGVRQSLVTGAQWPRGPVRPFFEVQLLHRFDNGSLDMHLGLAVPLS